MHNLVVRQRQNEVLGERVENGEGELTLVVFAVDGVLVEVFERVVHPAHVPFHAEAQAADIDGLGDHGPSRRFLCDHLHVREIPVDHLVETAQELDGPEVLPPAMLIRDPFAFLTRVVEIEHGGDAVDAQGVRVVRVQPEHGGADQVLADLMPAVVEDGAAPVRVKSETRVRVLVEVRAVEVAQAVFVRRKVRGHPVQDHADAVLVQVVDEEHQVLGAAVPAAGSEVAQRLITPRGVEWVLHDGKQLHVRETHLLDVLGQHGRDLVVAEQPTGIARVPPPGARMDFIDAERSVERVVFGLFLTPRVIAPGVVEVPDDRGRVGRQLPEKGEGVPLVDHVPIVIRDDVVFVDGPFPDLRDEAFPDSRAIPACGQRVSLGIPLVEVPDDGDLGGVGGPDGEIRPLDTTVLDHVGAQLLIEAKVIAFLEQVDVVIRQQTKTRLYLSLVRHEASLMSFDEQIR